MLGAALAKPTPARPSAVPLERQLAARTCENQTSETTQPVEPWPDGPNLVRVQLLDDLRLHQRWETDLYFMQLTSPEPPLRE